MANGVLRYRWFTCVLYPDCLEHNDMIKYLTTHDPVFECAYILHDRDVYDEDVVDENNVVVHSKGELKKPHWHVLIHTKPQYELTAIRKYFHIWEEHIEPVSNQYSVLLYMLHNTPDSMHKAQYDFSEFRGFPSVYNLIKQKNNFVQLGDVIDTLKAGDGSMLSVLERAVVFEDDSLLETIKQYQTLICCMTNQEFKRRAGRTANDVIDSFYKRVKLNDDNAVNFAYVDSIQNGKIYFTNDKPKENISVGNYNFKI